MTDLYRKVDAHPKVKKAFVGSGIRYDLLVDDFNKNNEDGNHDEYIEQVITRHVSGRLKVAPEHTSDATLRVMRKPSFKYFHKFKEKYDKISEKHGLKQQLFLILSPLILAAKKKILQIWPQKLKIWVFNWNKCRILRQHQ